MSPEQAAGAATDERADLYSLGVILYQMLTGEKPYVGATTDEILEQHRNAALPVLGAELAAYQPLLNKLLAKDPSQRFGSAREVLEALEQTAGAARPTPCRRPRWRASRRRRQALEIEQVAIGEVRRRHVLQAAEQPLGPARDPAAPTPRAWP